MPDPSGTRAARPPPSARAVTPARPPSGPAPEAEESVVSEEPAPTQNTPRPKGLLEQMEELMAALNADLSDLQLKSGFPPKAPQDA